MTYQELIDTGKQIFNFSPDEPFTNVGQILYVARENARQFRSYEMGASLYAETIARYVDSNKKEDTE